MAKNTGAFGDFLSLGNGKQKTMDIDSARSKKKEESKADAPQNENRFLHLQTFKDYADFNKGQDNIFKSNKKEILDNDDSFIESDSSLNDDTPPEKVDKTRSRSQL